MTQQKNEVEEEAKTKLREVEQQMEELKQQNTRDQQEYETNFEKITKQNYRLSKKKWKMLKNTARI